MQSSGDEGDDDDDDDEESTVDPEVVFRVIPQSSLFLLVLAICLYNADTDDAVLSVLGA